MAELELFQKIEWLEIEMFLTFKLCPHTKLNCLKKNYFHTKDLALNILQRLICHKTQPTNKRVQTDHICIFFIVLNNKLQVLVIYSTS